MEETNFILESDQLQIVKTIVLPRNFQSPNVRCESNTIQKVNMRTHKILLYLFNKSLLSDCCLLSTMLATEDKYKS